MANRSYNATAVPVFNSQGSSAVIRGEFSAISSGFTEIERELDAIDLSSVNKFPDVGGSGKVAKLQAKYMGLDDSGNDVWILEAITI